VEMARRRRPVTRRWLDQIFRHWTSTECRYRRDQSPSMISLGNRSRSGADGNRLDLLEPDLHKGLKQLSFRSESSGDQCLMRRSRRRPRGPGEVSSASAVSSAGEMGRRGRTAWDTSQGSSRRVRPGCGSSSSSRCRTMWLLCLPVPDLGFVFPDRDVSGAGTKKTWHFG